MSDLVGNPEEQFSRIVAHFMDVDLLGSVCCPLTIDHFSM